MFSMLLNIDILNIEIIKISTLIFGMLFFSAVFIQCGIVKEYKKINKSVFNFGIIVELIYMIYLYILNTSIYRYIIYIALIVLMAFINNKKVPEIARNVAFIVFTIIGIAEIGLILI